MPATGTVTVSSTSPRCSNDPPIIISLAGSQTGINYQLKINGANSGAPQAGTGSTLTWSDQGSGSYTVQAISTGGCTQMMSGEHVITVNPAPALYTVGGGGAVCTGSPFAITLSGSQLGVSYVLKRGTTTVSTLTGNGDNLSWGNQVLPGTYTITATNTTCTRLMGTVTVTLNTPPSPFSVSGGGDRCDDQPGLTVSLNGSQGGNIVTYQLKRDNVNVGAPVAGTGSALNWEGLTEAGTYTIQAIHSNGCTRIMNSSAPVVITTKAAPTPANAGADINACGTQTTLHANTPTVGTGVWSQIGDPIASTIQTPNSPSTSVSTTQPNTYVYAWTITNSNGCVSTDNVQVIYNAVATAASAGPDQTICDDVFAVMAANTPLVGNGEWILVSGPCRCCILPGCLHAGCDPVCSRSRHLCIPLDDNQPALPGKHRRCTNYFWHRLPGAQRWKSAQPAVRHSSRIIRVGCECCERLPGARFTVCNGTDTLRGNLEGRAAKYEWRPAQDCNKP